MKEDVTVLGLLILALVIGFVIASLFFAPLAHNRGFAKGMFDGYQQCLTDFEIKEVTK
jgi:hypothetical protein